MAVVHLDPWTDIVGVNWPQTYTHVAFEVQVRDSQLTGTTYDYPAASPPNPPGSFFSTSIQSLTHKVEIVGRYRMRTTAAMAQVWSAATEADFAISGYTLDGNTAQQFTKNWSECEHWSLEIGNRGPPSFTQPQIMAGFDSHRTQDSTISVPIATGEKFETFTTAALAYYTYPLTACVPTAPSTTLDTNSLERVEIAANVIGGLALTYKGTNCTVVGLWTPSLGLSPNVAIPLVQTPKRLFVLASID
jgi:hypothetical protein